MNDKLDILYHGEMQLLDWGESRTRGKFLVLRLFDMEDDPLPIFKGLDVRPSDHTSHILNVTISRGDILQTVEQEDYGKLATKLHTSGFFLAPHVLLKIGTDAEYLDWIRKQRSALSGDYSEYLDGEGRCIAAHIRRANESGVSYKPKYWAIPLTQEEHALQHQHGESYFKPPEWFEKKRADYVIKWAKENLLKQLGYESFKYVPPTALRDWCKENECTQFLPRDYRSTSL